MKRMVAAGLAFLSFDTTAAFADTARGNEAFSRGYYFTANREWRASANAGDPAAMLGLGTLYDTGHGLLQDFAEALSWYRRAAEAGNAAAMFNVGAMYDNGRGTKVDRAEAIRWYAMAAKKGNGRAAYAAATMYRDGDGVAQDNAAAIKFFRIAAAAGIEAARFNLAHLGEAASSKEAAASRRSPTAQPREPGVKAVAPKSSPPMQSATIDAAPVVADSLFPPPAPPRAATASAGLPAPSTPVAESTSPAVRPRALDGPASPASEVPASPETNVPVVSAKPSSPEAIQFISLNGMAAGIKHFHKAALQRADMSAAMSKQSADIVREIAHRAEGGDLAARYDAAFAFEHGIGMPSDPVKSYVYYILATLSPDVALKSAALKGAFEVGGQLSDAQHASASNMLTKGVP